MIRQRQKTRFWACPHQICSTWWFIWFYFYFLFLFYFLWEAKPSRTTKYVYTCITIHFVTSHADCDHRHTGGSSHGSAKCTLSAGQLAPEVRHIDFPVYFWPQFWLPGRVVLQVARARNSPHQSNCSQKKKSLCHSCVVKLDTILQLTSSRWSGNVCLLTFILPVFSLLNSLFWSFWIFPSDHA